MHFVSALAKYLCWCCCGGPGRGAGADAQPRPSWSSPEDMRRSGCSEVLRASRRMLHAWRRP